MFKAIKEFFFGKPVEAVKVEEAPYKVEAQVAPAVTQEAPKAEVKPTPAKKQGAPKKQGTPKKAGAPKKQGGNKPRKPKAPKAPKA